MPDDLSVRTVPQTGMATTATTAVKPAADPTESVATTQSETQSTVAMGPNPSFKMDPSLGIVVMTVRDAEGAVTLTTPSQQMLDAYKNGTLPIPSTAT